MVGPLVYDLNEQHLADLLREREADRLAAQVQRDRQPLLRRIHLPRLSRPLTLNGGAARAA